MRLLILNLIKSEAYRLQFLLGSFLAAVGILLWPLFYFGFLSEYPTRSHSLLMIVGFLLSFVSGFLMTAIPRMTATLPATLIEKCWAFAILVALAILSVAGQSKMALGLSVLCFLSLIGFFIRRKVKMKGRAMPVGFVFIPVGLLMGLLGSACLFLFEIGEPEYQAIGKLLLFEGFTLNLIVGLGSRLVPTLMRKAEALSPTQVGAVSSRLLVAEALVLNASFFVEAYFELQLGVLLRLLVLVYILFRNFLIHKPTVERTVMGTGVGLSALFLPLGYLAILMFPSQRVHLVHIVYIGGFTLLAFLVSVRISLAHGGASLDAEKSSKSILVMIGLWSAALLLRTLGPLVRSESAMSFYMISVFCGLGGILCWVFLVRKCSLARPQR